MRNGTKVLSTIGNVTKRSTRGVLASTTITILLLSVAVTAVGATYLYSSGITSEPQVQVTSLADEEVLAAGLVELRGTAEHNGQVQAVLVRIDGGPAIPVVPASDDFSEWSVLLPISSPGNHTIEVEAADSSGKKGSTELSVFVKDAESVIAVPEDQVVEATEPSGALVHYPLPAARGNVRSLGESECLPASGGMFSIGTTTVTCAANYAGGTVSANFTVYVHDTTPPAIKAPADVNAENSGMAFVKVSLGNPVVNDVVDESPVVSNNAPANGFGLGTTEVVWTAIDDYGNVATATQKVIVTAAAVEDSSFSNGNAEHRSSVIYSSGGGGGGGGGGSSKSKSDDKDDDKGKGNNGKGDDNKGGNGGNGDTGGNAEDTTVPSLTITSPANGGTVSLGTLAVHGTAFDSGSGISSVHVRLDGGSYIAATPKAAGDWSTWSASVNVAAAGAHTVIARATDNAGNTKEISVTLMAEYDSVAEDTTLPSVAITSPSSGSTISAGTLVVQGTASDSGSGINSVQVSLGSGAYVAATPKATDDWSTWTASLSVSSGQNTISARATDKADNQRVSSVIVTASTIDNTAPSVEILQPEADSVVTMTDGNILISGTASDIGSGVNVVEVRVDDGDYVSATPEAPGDWSSWSVTLPITAGEHRLVPRATDNSGNQAWNSIDVMFAEPVVEDTTSPAVEITSPADGSELSLDGSIIIIQGTASDSGSGIDVIEVRIDDGDYVAATPKAAGDWSNWSISLPVAEGERRIVPRATDNSGNQAWNSIYVTVSDSEQPPVQNIPEPAQDDIPDPLRTVSVSSLGGLMNAIEAARPGDHIVLEDGVYDSANTMLVRAKGTADNPIVITAETVGGVEIKGRAGFGFDGAAYLIVRGFKFTHSQDNLGGTAVMCDECNNVRLTRNHFALTSSENDEADWIAIASKSSKYNRIDHNIFENKKTRGNFIYLIGSDGVMTQHNRIDHNHFYRQTYSGGNEGECITAGHSAYSVSSSYTIIEYNLFEECNGDAEIISVKSSNNVVRANTFRNSDGSVVLRHGNDNVVDGNLFIDNKGGIRVYGHDHVIVNNYIEGNTGNGVRQPIVIGIGDVEEDGTTLNAGYSQPQNVIVAYNTLVGNSHHMVVGYGWTGDLPPLNTKIAYNIIIGDSGKLITYDSGQGTTWQGNILYGSASAGDIPGSGYEWTDPRLVLQGDGVYRIASSSPAIDAAGTSYSSYVTSDMDGQARSGDLDAGADEYSSQEIRHPLQRSDVGPNST